jgi:hypothetical protein
LILTLLEQYAVTDGNYWQCFQKKSSELAPLRGDSGLASSRVHGPANIFFSPVDSQFEAHPLRG